MIKREVGAARSADNGGTESGTGRASWPIWISNAPPFIAAVRAAAGSGPRRRGRKSGTAKSAPTGRKGMRPSRRARLLQIPRRIRAVIDCHPTEIGVIFS
jgi:hypothetical protein